MVEGARAAAAGASLGNVDVEVMDAEELQFDPGTFDVVINAFGLGFLRPDRALCETRRVLRDGGRLVASAPLGGGPNWEFFGKLCARYNLVSGAHPGGIAIPAPAELLGLFESAGLRVDPPVQDAVEIDFADEESWWRWVWSHGQRAFLEGLDDAEVAPFKAEAFAELRSFATPAGIHLEQQFLVVNATAV